VEEYISTSLSTMRRWIKRNRVTVFIIIHPRKPDSIKTAEDTAPEPYEAAGAAHWYNKADVFLSVHRVKYGEDAGKTTVHVKKHRREGISGMIGSMEFRYDRRASRFYEEGTIIPAEVGSNPYSLVMPTAREVVAVGQMEMESVPF
jgi:twinkle protein